MRVQFIALGLLRPRSYFFESTWQAGPKQCKILATFHDVGPAGAQRWPVPNALHAAAESKN